MRSLLLALAVPACFGGADAKLGFDNQTIQASGSGILPDGTSMRLRMIAVYLAEDVDPATMDNIGTSSMIWLAPECGGDISSCNVAGETDPAGPRVTTYFDLARPTAEVDADLNSQPTSIDPGTYRYARLELCKSLDGQEPSEPTMMWAGPGMTSEQPFTSGDCGRTSMAFDPPLALAVGDSVTVTLGYDPASAIVSAPPDALPQCNADQSHCYRACVDVDSTQRDCMDFPDFAPSATKD